MPRNLIADMLGITFSLDTPDQKGNRSLRVKSEMSDGRRISIPQGHRADLAAMSETWRIARSHIEADPLHDTHITDNMTMTGAVALTDLQMTGGSRTRETLRPNIINAACAQVSMPPDSHGPYRVQHTDDGFRLTFDEKFIDDAIEYVCTQLTKLPEIDISEEHGVEIFTVPMTEERLSRLYQRIR
ncbi:MAG: hypothetical protein OXC95_18655 [Dehalococcoidia bacterium]|nr:hypothetical protein [Dehalococcoidia bacterium]